MQENCKKLFQLRKSERKIMLQKLLTEVVREECICIDYKKLKWNCLYYFFAVFVANMKYAIRRMYAASEQTSLIGLASHSSLMGL